MGVILLCGGDKSSHQDDVRKAKAYWKEYNKHENCPTLIDDARKTLRDLTEAQVSESTARRCTLEKGLESKISSLQKREMHMRYPEYQAAGWPIGSGVVESSNKLVVEARLIDTNPPQTSQTSDSLKSSHSSSSPHRPAANHPWRKPFLKRFSHCSLPPQETCAKI